jgi:hypothetical protein
VLDQGRQKGLRYKRAFMQIGRIHTENRNLELVWYSSRKQEEKGKLQAKGPRTGIEQEQDSWWPQRQVEFRPIPHPRRSREP